MRSSVHLSNLSIDYIYFKPKLKTGVPNDKRDCDKCTTSHHS